MSIFDRIARLFRSNVNDLISSAEQPEKMLNQIIIDMRSQLVKAKQQVAAAIADEKRLQDQTASELREAEEWEHRAMLAVKENRDDLAKQATERLKDSLRGLNDNIEEATRKKNLLLAKQRRAEAQKRISETMSSISEKSAFEAFARMEEKIDQNERQIRAHAEIEGEFSGDRLAHDFKQLESTAGNATADAQLLALKQKMGLIAAPAPDTTKQLGMGTPEVEEIAEAEEIPDEKTTS